MVVDFVFAIYRALEQGMPCPYSDLWFIIAIVAVSGPFRCDERLSVLSLLL